MKTYLYVALAAVLGVWGCGSSGDRLPYLGQPKEVQQTQNGQTVTVSEYPTIPDFSFTNQDGQTVTQQAVAGKVYVADFFFVTCPTICPIMKRNLKKVYDLYHENPNVRLLSHSIDPDHDTPAVLKQYAADLGVQGTMWQFLTGDKTQIYDIAEKHYLVTAGEDSTAAGGYIHSGALVLVDKHRHVRGLYDGTKDEGVQKLIADIPKLLQEE